MAGREIFKCCFLDHGINHADSPIGYSHGITSDLLLIDRSSLAENFHRDGFVDRKRIAVLRSTPPVCRGDETVLIVSRHENRRALGWNDPENQVEDPCL